MRSYTITVLLVLMFFTGGCSTPTFVKSVIKKHDRPPLEIQSTKELGDTLVSHIYSSTKPSYKVVEDYNGTYILIKAGHILQPRYVDEKYEAYWAGMCRIKESGKWAFGQNALSKCHPISILARGFADIVVEPADYVDLDHPQLRQELIYNGKVGDSVKFLYREISGNVMRPAFTQDVQYDLSESTEIGFKGARLKIIAATNREITYQVIAYFSQQG